MIDQLEKLIDYLSSDKFFKLIMAVALFIFILNVIRYYVS